jgi:hypothetical protein
MREKLTSSEVNWLIHKFMVEGQEERSLQPLVDYNSPHYLDVNKVRIGIELEHDQILKPEITILLLPYVSKVQLHIQ